MALVWLAQHHRTFRGTAPMGNVRAGENGQRTALSTPNNSRFKAELQEEYPHLLPAWYAFRDARAHHRAVEWLADNSLVDHDAVTRFLDDHPEPAVP